MFVKIDGQIKPIERIELISDSAIILIHTEKKAAVKEVYKCLFDLPSGYLLRRPYAAEIFF